MQLFVLGMHHSGAEALGQLLECLGCHSITDEPGTDGEDERSSLHRDLVRSANDEILHRAACAWDRVADFDPDRIDADVVTSYRQALAGIVRSLDAHQPWYVTDPRLCLTLPLWRGALNAAACIHLFRDPVDVARTLERRSATPVPVGMALWEKYNVTALRASTGLDRVVVSYEQLVDSPLAVARRIVDELGGLERGLRYPYAQDVTGLMRGPTDQPLVGFEGTRVAPSESQASLLTWLRNAESHSQSRDGQPRFTDPSSITTLRDHETRFGGTPKSYGPDGAPSDATLSVELSRLRSRHDQLQREVVDGLETTLRNKDRDLLAAADRLANLEKDLVDARDRLRDKDHELQQTRDAKERERRRMGHELGHLRTRLAALDRLLDEAMDDAQQLLASRRWRLGDALLTLHRRLLGRQKLPTAADHLLQLSSQVEALRAEDSAKGSDVDTNAQRLVRLASTRAVQERLVAPVSEMQPDREHWPHSRNLDREAVSQVSTPPPHPTPRSTATSRVVGADALASPVRASKATVLVLAWDVGHNPLGRAYLLAEALSRSYRVVLAGFQFPRYGTSVWKPLRDASVRIVAIPGRPFPEFQGTLESLAGRVDADVVVACKARLPAIQAGLMMKAVRNRPLIVDVDDYELGFFNNRNPLDDPSSESPEDLEHPFEEAWTRYAENLLPAADRLLVSNTVLQGKFGGVLVPHARDESVFRPDRLDKHSARRELDLPLDERVVMFIGTPRPHKGVLEVLEAVKQVRQRLNCRFVIVGKPPDAAFETLLRDRGGNALHLIPDQPFDRLPDILAAADLVCVLQQVDSEVAKYQLPAKIVDAMAMQIPVLATDVPPLRSLIDDGVIDPVTPENLADRIEWWLTAPDEERFRHVQRARTTFVENYSYQAISRTLVEVVEGSLEAPAPLPHPARVFLDGQARRHSRPASHQDGLDLVMFWRQDDAGLYGRRFDMLVNRLARRPEIRRIAIFDPPYAAHRLWEGRDENPTTQMGEIQNAKLVRRWSLADTDKVSHHVFLFDKFGNLPHGDYPDEAAFPEFVAEELERTGIDPGESVFWYYPVFDELEALDERFQPRLRLVDVVDDQRAWPGRTSGRRDSMERHYRTLLGAADIVLANCDTVRDSLAEYAPDIEVVPNGCDLDPVPADPDNRRFARFATLEGPILGLVGNLEPKTDAALLERLARERPDCHVVLVGSTHSNPDILRLDEYDNVFFVGVVRYPEVKAWIRRFDVALLPHLDTEQTRAMHPLKLLVYASLGVPTIATGVNNLGVLAPFIDVADDHDAFMEALDRALAGGGTNREALARTVEANSWERRVDEIMQLVEAKLAQRPRRTQ